MIIIIVFIKKKQTRKYWNGSVWKKPKKTRERAVVNPEENLVKNGHMTREWMKL